MWPLSSGGRGGALVAGPLKNNFFAAPLIRSDDRVSGRIFDRISGCIFGRISLSWLDFKNVYSDISQILIPVDPPYSFLRGRMFVKSGKLFQYQFWCGANIPVPRARIDQTNTEYSISQPLNKGKMNSTHHFYPILIPNTSYVKIFILFVGGPQISKKKYI